MYTRKILIIHISAQKSVLECIYLDVYRKFVAAVIEDPLQVGHAWCGVVGCDGSYCGPVLGGTHLASGQAGLRRELPGNNTFQQNVRMFKTKKNCTFKNF